MKPLPAIPTALFVLYAASAERFMRPRRRMPVRRFPVFLRAVYCVMLCLSLLTALGCTTAGGSKPVAHNGVFDISAMDMEKAPILNLDGEWEFYWKQLLTPADFHGARPPVMSAFLTLPTAWNNVAINGEKLGGAGYATFRLQILPGREKQELTLRIGKQYSAYKLWANGVLLVENGVVGKNASEEISHRAIRQPRLHLDGRPVELLLQISNYHFRDGGIVSSIKLGSVEKLESEQMRKWALALMCVGSLLVMGAYHIGLYCIRRKDRAPLYFGIYSLLWATSSFTSNATDWAVNLVMEIPSDWFINSVAMLSFVISLPVGYSFFRTLYPREFSFRLQQITWLVALVFSVLGLTHLTMVFPGIVQALYLFALGLILYCIIMLLCAIHNRREAALLILAGFTALGGAGINDMLCDLRMIRSVYLIHIGMFIFILFQAIALSFRFSKSFSAVERLSDELSEKNRTLEDEMAERTRLEHKVVDISEDERRHISHELHDGLCQQLAAARLRFFVLNRKLRVSADEQAELDRLSALLDESVNHAYDLSRGLWPVELGPAGAIPSLDELVRRLSESSGIPIEFSRKLRCENCANRHIVQLHRIAQEAITNSVKHAKTDMITVKFDCLGAGIVLSVSDNGIGRSAAATSSGGLGTGIMHHRAKIIGGDLRILDIEGGGTAVVCTVACDEIAG